MLGGIRLAVWRTLNERPHFLPDSPGDRILLLRIFSFLM